MTLGNAHVVKSTLPGLIRVQGLWTGGGSAEDMTITSGDWSRGIASVAYNGATGKYIVTFTDCGQQIVWADARVLRPASGDDPLPANIDWDSYDATAKTILVEFGATLTDIDTDEKVAFVFEFAAFAP